MASLEAQREKAWRYVGRFIWAYAGVEAAIDNIFEIMFNLNAISCLLLQSNLDLRKKVNLIRLGFKSQGVDHRESLEKVHKLTNFRNVIAHSSFDPTLDDEGISFSYIDTSKIKSPEKEEDENDIASKFISYPELDEYHSHAKRLVELLSEIHCEPINEGAELIRDISAIMELGDNIIPFKSK